VKNSRKYVCVADVNTVVANAEVCDRFFFLRTSAIINTMSRMVPVHRRLLFPLGLKTFQPLVNRGGEPPPFPLLISTSSMQYFNDKVWKILARRHSPLSRPLFSGEGMPPP